jgi:ABC-type polar amino acid transport system ATPase subunit
VSLDHDRRERVVPELVASEGGRLTRQLNEPTVGRRIPVVVVEEARKGYGPPTAVSRADLKMYYGEVVAIIGASGSAKSNCYALSTTSDSLDGGPIVVGRRVGYRSDESTEPSPARWSEHTPKCASAWSFFAHLSMLDNVRATPVRVYGLHAPETTATALRLLDAVSLTPACPKAAAQAVGWAAAAGGSRPSPRDEPASPLDPELVGKVLNVMRHLADEGMTMLRSHARDSVRVRRRRSRRSRQGQPHRRALSTRRGPRQHTTARTRRFLSPLSGLTTT